MINNKNVNLFVKFGNHSEMLKKIKLIRKKIKKLRYEILIQKQSTKQQ